MNGKIYVIGGAGADNKPVASVQVYDPATGTWAARANMPTARALFGASAVGGTIYAVGGTTRGPDKLAVVEATIRRPTPGPEERTCRLPATPSRRPWSTGRSMRSAAGASTGRKAAGSLSTRRRTAKDFSTVEVYDPKTDTWATRADMPTARSQ